MDVVGEISVSGTRERSRQSMKEFQVAEVELNLEASVVQMILPGTLELLHGFGRFEQDPPLAFLVHLTLQFLREVPRVSHDDAVDLRIDAREDIAVVCSRLGEAQSEHSSFGIPCQRQPACAHTQASLRPK